MARAGSGWGGGVVTERAAPTVAGPARRPRVGEGIVVYGDRLPILAIRDRGQGRLVVTEDDAGLRIERPADRLAWDPGLRAWR